MKTHRILRFFLLLFDELGFFVIIFLTILELGVYFWGGVGKLGGQWICWWMDV